MLEDFVTQSVHLVHLYTQYFTDVEFSCFSLHTSHGLLYFILLSFHQCEYVGLFSVCLYVEYLYSVCLAVFLYVYGVFV